MSLGAPLHPGMREPVLREEHTLRLERAGLSRQGKWVAAGSIGTGSAGLALARPSLPWYAAKWVFGGVYGALAARLGGVAAVVVLATGVAAVGAAVLWVRYRRLHGEPWTGEPEI